MSPAFASRPQSQSAEGIAVTGEAIRRVSPDTAELLIEVSTSGQAVAQTITQHQNRISQIAQTVASLGVQANDVQAVSTNVANVYSPITGQLPAYGIPQLPVAGIGVGAFGAPAPLQPEIQFGVYQARSLVRVTVRDGGRAGEIADVLVKAGVTLAGGVSYRAGDESGARRSALDAACRDARAKAESLAAGVGRKLGEPIAISEDLVASNGVYSTLRTQTPWAFGPGAPAFAGEFEYYARVSASFRFE